jgi:septal ring factor EnvC (AmiA/AmiB activator)
LSRLLHLGITSEATLLRIGWAIAVVVPNVIMAVVLVVTMMDRGDLLRKMEADRQSRNAMFTEQREQFAYVDAFAKRVEAAMKRAEAQRNRIAEDARKAAEKLESERVERDGPNP